MELSIGEMLVVFLVIVILFGPDKIPSIARELGQGVRKMKSAVEDIKTEIMKETDGSVSDIKKDINEIKSSISDINPINNIKKQIEIDIKDSVSSMKQIVNSEDQQIYSEVSNESINSPAKDVNMLSDEYSGSVSR